MKSMKGITKIRDIKIGDIVHNIRVFECYVNHRPALYDHENIKGIIIEIINNDFKIESIKTAIKPYWFPRFSFDLINDDKSILKSEIFLGQRLLFGKELNNINYHFVKKYLFNSPNNLILNVDIINKFLNKTGIVSNIFKICNDTFIALKINEIEIIVPFTTCFKVEPSYNPKKLSYE
jgi:hypothetical protein